MSHPSGRPCGYTLKRKRPDTNFDIAIDSDSRADHLERQNVDDGYDAIDLTPSHQIPELLDSGATESTQTTLTGLYQSTQLSAPLLGHSPSAVPEPSPVQSNKTIRAQQHRPSTSSKQSTSAPKPHSSHQRAFTSEPQCPNLLTSQSKRPCAIPELEASSANNQPPDKPNDQSQGVQRWKLNEWDDDEFDSDEESMSLAVTMKLANELSLLKSFLDLYRKFNIHLGGKQNLFTNTRPPLTRRTQSLILTEVQPDIVSGPRHRGFLLLISSTVTRVDTHTTHLRTLRNEKQRGNPYPGNMELIAEKISRKCKTRSKYLWDLMEEKVDMANDVERARWVKRKKAILGDVMGGLVGYLEELGDEGGWKEREVREMGQRWEKRWKVYGAMDREELKSAGWILDVGKPAAG